MTKQDETMATFLAKIDELTRERRAIDDKLAALDLAYEALYGTAPPRELAAGIVGEVAVKPRRKRERKTVARYTAERTNDRRWRSKTLAELAGRKRAADIATLAKATGCTPKAMQVRLSRLAKDGVVERVERGRYVITIEGTDEHNGMPGTRAPEVAS